MRKTRVAGALAAAASRCARRRRGRRISCRVRAAAQGHHGAPCSSWTPPPGQPRDRGGRPRLHRPLRRQRQDVASGEVAGRAAAHRRRVPRCDERLGGRPRFGDSRDCRRGETWTQQFAAPAEQRPLLDVLFVNKDTGFAIGAYGAFYETGDGDGAGTRAR